METFIHYSSDNKIYKSKDPDSISRTGILIETTRKGSTYTANTLTQYKTYKTLKGAQKFMEKSGRRAIASEDHPYGTRYSELVFLSSSAEKANKRKKK